MNVNDTNTLVIPLVTSSNSTPLHSPATPITQTPLPNVFALLHYRIHQVT